MKHYAKPITSRSRPAAPTTPAKKATGGTSYTEETSANKKDSSGGEVIETVTTSGSDANVLQNVAGKVIGGGYKGKKMSNEAWKKYLASESPERKTKRLAREVKDGVREAPKPSANTSTTSTEVTHEKVMDPAVPEKTGSQTYAWEVRNNERAGRIANWNENRNANKGLRKMNREGITVDGELVEGASDEARATYESYKATKGGYGKQARKRANQDSEQYTTGSNNANQGNKIITREGQDARQASGEGLEDAQNISSSTSTTTGAADGTTHYGQGKNATLDPKAFADRTEIAPKGMDTQATNTYGANVPQIERSKPLPKTEGQLQNEADAIVEESFSDPAEFKGKSAFLMKRSHSSKSPAKMWNTDVSPAKEGETVREHSPAGEAKMKKADKAAKNARWAAASPAKQQKPTKDYLANTAPGTVDNRPASLRQKYAEQEKREATPSWQAKFNPKEGGKISATKAKSPAKMWGPSKVKAGKNGFNR